MAENAKKVKKLEEDSKSKNSTSTTDEQQLKTISAVGYLGILFLLPYLMFPKEKFAVFHANQGLLLTISAFIAYAVGSFIPIFGWLLIPLIRIGILVLFIIGLTNALNGRMKRLPIIGGFDLLKISEDK